MATPPDRHDARTGAAYAAAQRESAPVPAADSGSAPPRRGQPWAGYHIVRTLARGASGTLYAAIDPRQGQLRALKVLNTPAGLDSDEAAALRGRFAQQAAALQQLSHPAIVDVHDAGEAGQRVYVAMSLLPGTDLRRHAQPPRLLPEPLLLELGARLADALAHAHERGIVHRDLKPANVVFDAATRRVWLTDFGAARLAGAELTRTGMLLGTPAFMPPEQLAGAAADECGDVYGLGATLFQLLTGRLPHEGTTLGDLLKSMSSGRAAELRTLRPDLPSRWIEPVDAALRREAGARPTAKQLAAWLRDVAAEAARA